MPGPGLFSGYGTGAAVDEMFAADGSVRETCRFLHDALSRLGEEEFAARSASLARSYLLQGVTFGYAGEERPFPIDAIPRVIAAEEWAHVSIGVAQRVRALEAFLQDVYADRTAIADGVVPARLVESSRYVIEEMRGHTPPGGVRIHISGIDLIRDGAGSFRVLEDNVRTPSGVSYVLSNRRAMAQTFPELFAERAVRRVDEYPGRLLRALEAAAPSSSGEPPTVVVLTPGRYNGAYFEHSLLARTMGVELVEGSDLVVRGERVYMRTTGGLRRVDVIYRRLDDDFLDPEVFRRDSVLGVPGLVGAVRAGNVALANAIGTGVADDKLTYTYVPDLIRYYLGEEPVLENVDTWRLEEPAAREEVLDRLEELVVKPVDGSGGTGIVIGPAASRDELSAMRARLAENPRGWIAQPLVQLSTIPTLVDGGPGPRHVDLRPFALNTGGEVWVLPGGLTRVALPEGEIIVNSSRGGGSKDTWVLESGTPTLVRVPTPTGAVRVVEAAGADEPLEGGSPGTDQRRTGRHRAEGPAREPRTETAAIPIVSTHDGGSADDDDGVSADADEESDDAQ